MFNSGGNDNEIHFTETPMSKYPNPLDQSSKLQMREEKMLVQSTIVAPNKNTSLNLNAHKRSADKKLSLDK